MRKCKIVSSLFCLCLLALGGCEKRNEFLDMQPETLTVTAEYPTEYPTTCSVYSVDYYSANEADLKTIFMAGQEPNRYEYAEGPQYCLDEGSVQFYLNVYARKMKGGFTFTTSSEDNSLKSASFRNQINLFLRKQECWEYTGDDVALTLGNGLLAKYDDETDLSFSSYNEVYEIVLKIMEESEIPECELLASASCDVKTMNENREIYNDAVTHALENGYAFQEKPIRLLTTADEYYFFSFRQMLDNLPITNVAWSTAANSFTVLPRIHVLYSQLGIMDFSAVGVYEIGKARSSCTIIPPQDAVDVFLSEYSRSLHFDHTDLIGIELNYVVVYDGRDLIARPAWILTTVTVPENRPETSVDQHNINKYQFYAISADTGVLLERETDTR